jgi:hydrogenase small subunit
MKVLKKVIACTKWVGCSAKDFWDAGSFYSRDKSVVDGFIESDSDTLGKVALGAVGVGLAAHAVVSNFAKKDDLKRRENQGKVNEKQLEN